MSINETLRTDLLQMRAADLQLRAQLISDGTLFHGYNARMAELHRRHCDKLTRILTLHGWPGRSLVGADGAAAAWLVLQHAIVDPALMRRALPLLEAAVATGEAEASHLALLTDRIRTLEGRPQLYGTSHDWDEHGELNPHPIEDAANVDARRFRMGLEPQAENTRRLRAQASAEREKPPADYRQRQHDMDLWARTTGWRK